MTSHVISGFSKLSRSEKLTWLEEQAGLSLETIRLLNSHLHPDPELQALYADISENNISNFYLPLGLAPNFLINGALMTVPMVIEESSVVAAASNAAKFWAMHGGFRAEVVDTLKNGQVHFTWTGGEMQLQGIFQRHKEVLRRSVTSITERMEQRGGGIADLEIRPSGPATSRILPAFCNIPHFRCHGGQFYQFSAGSNGRQAGFNHPEGSTGLRTENNHVHPFELYARMPGDLLCGRHRMPSLIRWILP